MLDDGSLVKLVDDYFSDDLLLADLKHRRIIHLENGSLPEETPLDQSVLWIDINQY